MIPLTENPMVIVEMDNEGDVIKVTTNVCPELKVVVLGENETTLDVSLPYDVTKHLNCQ